MIYRNKKLLDLANECEQCQSCLNHGRGTISAAHSNQLRDGKGRGVKAHDYRIAYLCYQCHYELDQGTSLSKTDRNTMWEEAHRRTIGWLFENGHLKVV